MNRKVVLVVLRRLVNNRRRLLHMLTLQYHYEAFIHKTPKRTSMLSGAMWMEEKMMGNPHAFVENFRMSREVFIELQNELVARGDIVDSPMVSASEQLATFLYFAGHHSTSSELQERFQHSGHTITRYLRVVLSALIKLSKRYIKIPSDARPPPRQFLSSPKFNPFFLNCRMAVDGTHIPIWVPEKDIAPFQGRKGVTMNVMAACDFDMLFTYVLAGWEGSAADARVYNDALQKGFTISPTLFDIMDAGFALTSKSLTPYRSTRYHLKEFARGSLRPQTKEELFNLRHAQARNVIERIFGVLKMRFPVLCYPVKYGLKFQVKLVIALCGVHNFVRLHSAEEDHFFRQVILDLREQNCQPMAECDEPVHNLENEGNEAKSWRDGIAAAMWDQYQETLRSRRRNS